MKVYSGLYELAASFVQTEISMFAARSLRAVR
jgi:hypothetical protein